jgi:transposase-like protein
VTSAERHGGSRPKRRSALCWKDCAARPASPSSAARRESHRACITAGRRSSWRPASGDWPATRHLRATSDEVKTLRAEARALKEALAEATLEIRHDLLPAPNVRQPWNAVSGLLFQAARALHELAGRAMSLFGRAPRRRESSVEEDSTRRVVD